MHASARAYWFTDCQKRVLKSEMIEEDSRIKCTNCTADLSAGSTLAFSGHGDGKHIAFVRFAAPVIEATQTRHYTHTHTQFIYIYMYMYMYVCI
jgi:hypothetical protein